MEMSVETKAALEVMQYLKAHQDDPMVGVFWYDKQTNDLFGIYSDFIFARDWYYFKNWDKDVKTTTISHGYKWAMEQRKGKDDRFKGDYRDTPAGRVYEIKDEGFRVCTDDWLEKLPNVLEVKDMILFEFQLPKDKTEFVTDIWDIENDMLFETQNK